jgi:hypothetical protein
MLIYAQLPFCFNARQMQQEVNALADTYWRMHYNITHYKGDWSVIALRSQGGEEGNIFSVHHSSAHTQYKDTPLLSECPSIKEALDKLQCEKTMVRLMKLNAGAVIKQHKDHDMYFEAGEARFHIPVQTNDKVEFYLEEERIPMKEGECWYLNLNIDHRVNNFGITDRIHLVVDCLVNDWMKELFEGPGLHKLEREETARRKYSEEDRIRIIASLRMLNTPVALEMAKKLELENE